MLVNRVNYVASTIFEMGCMITNVMSHVATENSVTIINDKKTHRCRQVHHATFILQSETESGCAFHQFCFFYFFLPRSTRKQNLSLKHGGSSPLIVLTAFSERIKGLFTPSKKRE